MLILCVILAKNLILVVGRIVRKLWMSRKMWENLIQKNWFVLDAVLCQWVIVHVMEKNLLSLSANFVVQSHNGFVGVTLISVINVIVSKFKEHMCQK